MYICQCYSFNLSHPLLLPQCPQVFSLCLLFSSCSANKVYFFLKVEKDAWEWEILLHLPQLPLMETRELLGLVGVCRASGEGLVSDICLHNPWGVTPFSGHTGLCGFSEIFLFSLCSISAFDVYFTTVSCFSGCCEQKLNSRYENVFRSSEESHLINLSYYS